jgi:hypothetical protein
MSPDAQGLTRGNTPSAASSGRSDGDTLRDYDSQPIYRGQRDSTAPVGEEVEVTVDSTPLDYRFDLLSASPSGFEWGYGGSGPAQLAIAILAHAYGDEFAKSNYQRLKDRVISELPEDGWSLNTTDLDAWRREVISDD